MDNKEYIANDEGSVVHLGMRKLNDDGFRDTQKADWNEPQLQNGHVEIVDGKEDVEKEKTEKPKTVGVLEVFRFADWKDKALLAVGIICAIVQGVAFPIHLIFFGGMIDSFSNNKIVMELMDQVNWNETQYTRDQVLENVTILEQIAAQQNLSDFNFFEESVEDNMFDTMAGFALQFCILGAVVFAAVSIASIALHITGARQAKRIRVALFRSILRQDITWYDLHQTGELSTRLSDDVNKIHEGIGDKIQVFFHWTSTFVTGLAVGFFLGWKLAVVVLAFVPLLALCGFTMAKLVMSFTSKELGAYAKAGAVAEEVLGAIRTVYAFGGQKKECERYAVNLTDAVKFGNRIGMISGIGLGMVFSILYTSNAVNLWWGSTLVRDDELSPGRMLTVLFAVTMGGMSLGNASPAVGSFATARGAAYALWQIIDRVPVIDSSSKEGKKPEKIQGNIELRNVKFRYPARPDVQVMRDVSLKVNSGQTVALVGPSGCGKSTSVQLIQRFYDPDEGDVLLDGINVKDLNVTWLRQQIGVVSQEPVLFATTIGENIRYGRDGVTQAEIEAAAREANAHSFIAKLPDRYDTLVGERGAQLSGGQKQRIAIARALVRNPKILLLDEATSALDTESEATVQAALDKARKGRTTIVIAHRLSTVRTADVIIGIENGRVMEKGTHEELMEKKGIYYTLVTNQSTKSPDELKEEEESELEKEKMDRLERQHSLRRQFSSVQSQMSDSVAGDVLAEELAEDEKEVSLTRLFRLNAPEWKYIMIGCLGALGTGASHPVFAILITEIMRIFTLPLHEQEDQVRTVCGYYGILIAVSFTSHFLQGTFMGKSGEGLTHRLRSMTFKSLLRQDIAYFDNPRNNVGALCTRLATGASAVKGATGARLALVLQDMASVGTAVVIGFIYVWKFTLAVLAMVPFVLGTGMIQMKMLGGMTKQGHAALEDAGKVAVEGIENIRTVAALTKEDTFVEWYHEKILEPYKNSRKGTIKFGLVYGFSQSLMFFLIAGAFTLAAYLIDQGDTDFNDVFRAFFAIVMSAMQAGRAASLAPDFAKAKIAAAKIFAIIDREPEIDNLSEDGKKPQTAVKGKVEFKNVDFRYPTRLSVPVLQGLNLKVNPGQILALVGSSGCGKSTSIQLLERFYDPMMGVVTLDGEVISELNINWLRSQMGIVSQEPVLFDASIQENIAYGDNSREVPMSEIVEAARNANIHEFIRNLPEGYQTNVGDKGTQLSGGQKQRIAIARALVRNPKILLLDEATSALDTESEKVVQEALDRAQEGRTSIVIAHRLSTIQNADVIAVIHHGQVVELGTHSELITLQGRYYKLNNAQLNYH